MLELKGNKTIYKIYSIKFFIIRLFQEYGDDPDQLNINCIDPLNRTALISAIENENMDLIKLLLELGIKVKDALLHAIKEEYVEAVELLLSWEEKIHKPGEPYVFQINLCESFTIKVRF